jgi:type IV pilus assembly protein PilE
MNARGFTLVELMISLAIMSIIATLAVTSYERYVRRAGRVDATSALLRIASAQEKFYAQNGQYADDLAAAPPDGLGIEGTERGYYELDVAISPDGAGIGYTASATVDEAGSQASDTGCQVFSINERGIRGAEDDGGATSQEIIDRCWR